MRTSIIPIFIPHLGCTHQCIFCNQSKITGASTNINPSDIETIINTGLSRIGEAVPEVAFYGGSFTALPEDMQQALLKPVYRFLQAGRIRSIRISTRPDCVTDQNITLLKNAGVATIELGAQSLDDSVLQNACRGHTYQHISDAVKQIKKASLQCGLQLMIGLPGEDWQSFIVSAQRAALLAPDFFRIYPTVVIAHTPLAEAFRKHEYSPLTLEQAVARCAYLKLFFEYRHQIRIIRIGLQANEYLENPETVLSGPYHPAFGEMVDAYLFYIMISRVLETTKMTHVQIQHHPKDHSKIRGIRNSNLQKLKIRYKLKEITLTPGGLVEGQLIISNGQKQFIMNPQMIFFI